MAYTDLFNEGFDAIAATLTAATGLRVVTAPAQIAPPCIFLDAPDIEAFSNRAAKMFFPIQVITNGPANAQGFRNVLNLCANVLLAGVGMTEARPTVINVGGVDYAAYNLRLNIEVYDV